MLKTSKLCIMSVGAILVFMSTAGCGTAPSDSVTTPPVKLNISASIVMSDAVKELNRLYTEAEPWCTFTTNFASAGTIQQQIENGAPCDVFISAAPIYMDNLQKDGLILESTRKDLLNNKIVLVVPIDSKLNITSFSDLAGDALKKIAIGDPRSVSAGTYAQQVFDLLGITASLQPKLVLASDVRQVLTYVETVNVDAGVVFSTDALTSTKVKVVASAPAEINAEIVYPVAIIKSSKNVDAATAYVNFLFSTEAKAVFEKFGFTSAVK